MNLLTELIIISLIGGIVAMDTTASWQIQISQPIVACTFIGYIFGDLQMGLLIGILLELPWLIEIPVGGAHISEGNLGSFVSAGLAIHLVRYQVDKTNIIIILAILWGLMVSWLGGKFVNSMRTTNVLFAYRADKAATGANFKKITLLNMGGVGHSFSLGFLLIGISFITGLFVVARVVAFIPQFFDRAFSYGKIGMLALGLGALIGMFTSRHNFHYFLIGIILALLIYFLNLFFPNVLVI